MIDNPPINDHVLLVDKHRRFPEPPREELVCFLSRLTIRQISPISQKKRHLHSINQALAMFQTLRLFLDHKPWQCFKRSHYSSISPKYPAAQLHPFIQLLGLTRFLSTAILEIVKLSSWWPFAFGSVIMEMESTASIEFKHMVDPCDLSIVLRIQQVLGECRC